MSLREPRCPTCWGLEGKLIYRGYDIDELAGKISFEETAYLLWEGELPKAKALAELKKALAAERDLPTEVVDYILRAPKDAGPMDILRTCVSMLGLYDYDAIGAEHVELNRQRQISLTAKIGVIAAYFTVRVGGSPFHRFEEIWGKPLTFFIF